MGLAAELEGAAANVPVMVPALALVTGSIMLAAAIPADAKTPIVLNRDTVDVESIIVSPKKLRFMCSLLTTRSENMELICQSRTARPRTTKNTALAHVLTVGMR